MTYKLLLRIASIAMLVHFLGHTMGHLMWRDTPDAEGVIGAMAGTLFPFMGTERSFADYYEGFSWFVVLMLAAAAVWLWVLSSRPVLDRALLWPLAIMLLGFAGIELVYFFPFAAGMSALAGICTVVALVRKS